MNYHNFCRKISAVDLFQHIVESFRRMSRGTHSAIGFFPYIKTCENGLHQPRDRAQNFAVADDPLEWHHLESMPDPYLPQS